MDRSRCAAMDSFLTSHGDRAFTYASWLLSPKARMLHPWSVFRRVERGCLNTSSTGTQVASQDPHYGALHAVHTVVHLCGRPRHTGVHLWQGLLLGRTGAPYCRLYAVDDTGAHRLTFLQPWVRLNSCWSMLTRSTALFSGGDTDGLCVASAPGVPEPADHCTDLARFL